MWFLVVIEGLIFAFIFLFVITQIIVPLFRGTVFFPFFRKDFKKLDAELSEVETLKEKRRIEKLINQERDEIEKGVKDDTKKNF